jgi:hypothetical protein
MAQLPFNVADVPANQPFEPVPQGDYDCQVIASEIKDTKAGTGKILKLTVQITTGAHTGRLIFDNLNVNNPNPEAERISQRALADLLTVVGLTVMHDTEELHFKPFKGRIGIRHDKNGAYPPQNTIRYLPRDGSGHHTPLPAVEMVKPTVVTTNKPWQKPAARY